MPSSPSAFDRRWRSTTLGLTLVASLIAFEAMAVATALPTAVADLDGLAYYGWPFTGFLVAHILGMVGGGALGDRLGARLPLLAGLAVFAAGLLLAGFAPGMAVFVAGRAVQGLGAGFVIVALYVVVGSAYPDRVRPSVFAAISAAWVLPALIGPLVAGLLTDHLSWRWVFLGLPPLIGLALFLLVPAVRGLVGPEPGGLPATLARRLLAAAGAGVGIVVLLYAVDRSGVSGVLAALAGAVLLAVSARHLLPTGTVRLRRGLPTVVGFRGLLAGSFFAVDALLPLTLTQVHGYGPTAAGLPLMTGAVGWSAGSWLQGRYPDLPRQHFVRAGFGLLTGACLAMVLIVSPVGAGWQAYPIWVVAGMGMGMAMPSLGVLLLELSPPAERGANSASMQVADVMTSALTVGAAGALISAVEAGSISLPVAVGTVDLAMAALAVVGVLAAGRVRSTQPLLPVTAAA